ncbi:putative DNA-binding domain-containing protein [uncultured Oxalicibacterium sp.]|uniref:HvfC/BufC family peptide modification chaperone n=1 Tax=uncultured Oxalicibacterium sp. TaxID=1168540 RepID=UPI0025EA5568|nr:putative DNA-binding domain-containing protein [uncultured Oxalicibacterium sp.]
MLEDFYLYVRGKTEVIPSGYSESGMRAYRHLVFIGASQMIEAHFPELREQMGEASWQELIKAFVRQSSWTSHYYGDLKDEFLAFLARESAQ